jgi:hypothetical protein
MGETADIARAVDFWQARGFTRSFEITMPVSQGKHPILNNPKATSVTLNYLAHASLPMAGGIEFLSHHPGRKPTGEPGLAMALRGAGETLRDPDGNTITFDPQLDQPTEIRWKTPDPAASGKVLQALGFHSSRPDTWALSSPLPRRGFQVTLQRDTSRPWAPRVDTRGWNGMSLLAADLGGEDTPLPLIAYQSFQSPLGGTRDVAFYAGAGLLVEFIVASPS